MTPDRDNRGAIEIVAVQGAQIYVSGWIVADAAHELVLYCDDLPIAAPLVRTSGSRSRFVFVAQIPVGFDDLSLLRVACGDASLKATQSTAVRGKPPAFLSIDDLDGEARRRLASGAALVPEPGRRSFLFELSSSVDSIEGVLIDLAAPTTPLAIHLMGGVTPIGVLVADELAALGAQGGEVTTKSGFGFDPRSEIPPALHDDLWFALGDACPPADDRATKKILELNSFPDPHGDALGAFDPPTPFSLVVTGPTTFREISALSANLPAGSEVVVANAARDGADFPARDSRIDFRLVPATADMSAPEAFLLAAERASRDVIVWVRTQRAAGRDIAEAVRAAANLVATDGVGVAAIAGVSATGRRTIVSTPSTDGLVIAFGREHLAPLLGDALDDFDDASFDRLLHAMRHERVQDIVVGVERARASGMLSVMPRPNASLRAQRERSADLFGRPGYWTGAAPRILLVADGRHAGDAGALAGALREIVPARVDIRPSANARDAAPFDVLVSYETAPDLRGLTNGAMGFSAYHVTASKRSALDGYHGTIVVEDERTQDFYTLARQIVSTHRDLAANSIRFAIKIEEPTGARGFFLAELAECLADALRHLGHAVRVDVPRDWNNPLCFADDFVLVLGCAAAYRHVGLAAKALWIVDDSTQISPQTMDGFDCVFVATPDVDAISKLTKANVAQLTPLLPLGPDDRDFRPTGANALVYVGDYGGRIPAGLRHALTMGLPVVIHGEGWEDRASGATIKGPAPVGEDLWRLYSLGQAILFDIEPELARLGFLPLGAFEALRMGSEPLWEDHGAPTRGEFAAFKTFSGRRDFEKLVQPLFDMGAARDPALVDLVRHAELTRSIETSAAKLVEVAKAAIQRS